MDKLVKAHRDKEEIDFKEMWKSGIFIFDSNVLLDLYRLPESARTDLLEILKNDIIKDRIWIGFQVLIEFLNNRLEAIGDQKGKFGKVKELISNTINDYNEILNKLSQNLDSLKLKQRHSLINPDEFINDYKIRNGSLFLHDFLEKLKELEEKQKDVNDSDSIKKIVIDIFNSKIGPSFDKAELEEIYKEGATRYAAKIPPGYKDSEKDGSYFFEDKEYIRKFGNLLLWKEIIKKCKSDNLKYVVLVTGDVKEDWWMEKRGKKLGPRIELLNEIYTAAPSLDTFYIYDTSSFLKHAKSELKLDIKDSSIEETKELIEFSRSEKKVGKKELVSLSSYIQSLVNYFSNLNFMMESSVYLLPDVLIDKKTFSLALFEIFDNVLSHSRDKLVKVTGHELEEVVQIEFWNLKKHQTNSKFTEKQRYKGFDHIKSFLAEQGIDI